MTTNELAANIFNLLNFLPNQNFSSKTIGRTWFFLSNHYEFSFGFIRTLIGQDTFSTALRSYIVLAASTSCYMWLLMGLFHTIFHFFIFLLKLIINSK